MVLGYGFLVLGCLFLVLGSGLFVLGSGFWVVCSWFWDQCPLKGLKGGVVHCSLKTKKGEGKDPCLFNGVEG